MSNVTAERTPDGWRLAVWVQPNAGRDAIVGPHGDAVKVAVGAPPEKGRANQAVCRVLAQSVGCRTSNVTVVRGETARGKQVVIDAPRDAVARFLKQINDSKGEKAP